MKLLFILWQNQLHWVIDLCLMTHDKYIRFGEEGNEQDGMSLELAVSCTLMSVSSKESLQPSPFGFYHGK